MFNVIEEALDISSIHFSYLTSEQSGQFDVPKSLYFNAAVVFTRLEEFSEQWPFHYNPEIHEPYIKQIYGLLDKLEQVMAATGILYIYGLPQWLPYFSVYLSNRKWQFKYWLALEARSSTVVTSPLVKTHEGILLFVRNSQKFSLRKVRSPHQKCNICGDFVADWGGKKHLRNPLGYAISDVWDDLPAVKDEKHVLSKEVWQRLIFLTAKDHAQILCAAYDGIQDLEQFIFE